MLTRETKRAIQTNIAFMVLKTAQPDEFLSIYVRDNRQMPRPLPLSRLATPHRANGGKQKPRGTSAAAYLQSGTPTV